MVAVADVTATEGDFECRQFGSMMIELRHRIEWLRDRDVQEAVMESTAQYTRHSQLRQPRSKPSAAAPDRVCESFLDGFYAIWNGPQGTSLACRLRYDDRNRIGMDIQTQEAYFTHDPLLIVCGLRRFAVSTSQRNPRTVRNWGWSLHND